MIILYLSIFHILFIKIFKIIIILGISNVVVIKTIGGSQVEIWAGLGTTFAAAQQAGLKTQKC